MGYLAGAERSLAAVEDAIDERDLTDAAKSIVRASRRVVMGGMQAAITAADQGHNVVLCEKNDRLGGALLCEEKVPFKEKLDHIYNMYM